MVWQLLVPDQGEEHKEEDQAGEEEPQPSLRLHICLQGAQSGAAAGDVSGADRVG